MLRPLIALLIALAASVAPAAGRECGGSPFPLDHRHPLLQQRLAAALRSAGMSAALRNRTLAVALVDLSRPGEIYYAGLNDDHMMYAASLPKIGILLALTEALDRGEVAWDDSFRWRITKMITISSNADATWAAKLVGLRGIARVLRDPRYCLYDMQHGGVWVGRAFEKGGESYRDPLKAISHGASARQAARFYLMLDRGALVSRHWSAWMRERMAPPEYFHKFVRALRERPGVRFLARKSGTWQHFHSDSALIQHASARYILVGLAEHAEGEHLMQELAHIADDIVVAGHHRNWISRPTAAGRGS
ncbi:MAG: serine hydrolase [Planctomycetota bacterium]